MPGRSHSQTVCYFYRLGDSSLFACSRAKFQIAVSPHVLSFEPIINFELFRSHLLDPELSAASVFKA